MEQTLKTKTKKEKEMKRRERHFSCQRLGTHSALESQSRSNRARSNFKAYRVAGAAELSEKHGPGRNQVKKNEGRKKDRNIERKKEKKWGFN